VAQSTQQIDKYADNVNKAGKIFAENEGFIRAVIRYKVRDDSQAQAIFQDFFLSLVYKPIPQAVKNVKSYIYRAISNDIIDAVRRMERYDTYIRKYSEQVNYSINKTNPKNASITEERYNEALALIKRRLTPTEYKAISLRYEKNNSIEDVAEKMGVNKRTISSYISVGLKKVREFLIEERVD